LITPAFGELCLFEDSPDRQFTIVTTTQAEVRVLTGVQLRECFVDHPGAESAMRMSVMSKYNSIAENRSQQRKINLGVVHVAGEQELEDIMQPDSVPETLPPDGLPSAPLLCDERPMVNSDWTQVENDVGEDYWWNKASGETTFDPPEGLMDLPEPDYWVVVEATDGGRDYYWNQTTGETKFDPPNTALILDL
jgi:hypothetical protein